MFREMRRKDHLLSEEETWTIIKNGKYGVLSLNGDNGYPYGVPMFYVVIDGKLFIHGSNEKSHRNDSTMKDTKMSFTIIDMSDTTTGASVII